MTFARSLPALFLTAVAIGCADPAAVVRPARVASNAAADALVILERLEVARITQVATKNAVVCNRDRACLEEAWESAVRTEQPRIAAINTGVATQQAVAECVISYDACRGTGDGQQSCEARAMARLAALAPDLAHLIEQTKEAKKL